MTRNPTPRLIFEAFLGLYLALGLYGSIWISVDWDEEKLLLFSYVNLPLAFLYYALNGFYPDWKSRFPRIGKTFVTALFGLFFVGHILWINAATSQVTAFKRDISIAGSVVTIENQRGGFGINFIRRW
jgi:hypothetical protein